MFIGDYPAIHYGSVLYIIQHDGHCRVTVGIVKQSHHSARKETINIHGKSDYSYQTTQFYVNTSQAEMKSVLDKIRSCSDLRMANVYDQHGEMKLQDLVIGQHQTVYGYYIEPNDTIALWNQ